MTDDEDPKRNGRATGPRRAFYFGFVLILIVAVGAVRTLSAEEGHLRWTLYSENDSPYYKPNESTDENRTNAAGVSLHYRPDWARDIANDVPGGTSFGPADYAAGFVIGHEIFTPEDITIARPQPNDRPWAGYLFVGLFWQRVRADRSMMDHVQVDLGMVGPATQADSLQTTVHSYLNSPKPRGWDNQLPNEPTVNVKVHRQWRVLSGTVSTFNPNFRYDVLPLAGASAGTVRREARAGVTGRFGWKVPENFGPGRLEQVSGGTGEENRGFAAYVFGRATGRAVQHDLFLDGSEFHDSPSVDREPLVGELQAGVKLRYRAALWQMDLGYGQTIRSRQFQEQDDSHGFGMWTVSLSSSF